MFGFGATRNAVCLHRRITVNLTVIFGLTLPYLGHRICPGDTDSGRKLDSNKHQ